MKFTATDRRATGRTWVSFGARSSYIDLDTPGSPPLAAVTRDGDGFLIEVRGEYAERFCPPTKRRAWDQAEARALELLSKFS